MTGAILGSSHVSVVLSPLLYHFPQPHTRLVVAFKLPASLSLIHIIVISNKKKINYLVLLFLSNKSLL